MPYQEFENKMPNAGTPLGGCLALVTGAGQGIGRAIAIGISKAGAAVIVTDLCRDTAAETATAITGVGGQSWSFPLDVRNLEECERLSAHVAAEIGLLDVLVNNAGILIRGDIDSVEAPNAWASTFAVNADGPFNLVRAFLAALRSTEGAVINIGSIQSFVAIPNSFAYTASKGAVLQLTKAMAAELAVHRIRVNGVAPGFMNTPLTAKTQADHARLAAILAHVPMGRIGQPEELSGAVVFLASRAASYITGVMLPVDGGYLAL